MKNTLLIVLLAFIGLSTANAQVGVGTTTPDASAILDVESTDKGFLPPRMTTAERNGINSGVPAEGLVIYNTTTNCLQWFDGGLWFDACSKTTEAPSNANLTVANPTYQGTSVINTTGIGYNGKAVPAASTITVELTNALANPQSYGLVATDPTTGLSYTATGTIAGSASGISVVLNHNEAIMPDFSGGVITMALLGASNTLNLVPRIDVKSIPLTDPDWTYQEVIYGSQTWMDRNLGARRVATALNDVFSYGSHYQWGRPADGHEITVMNGTSPSFGRGLEDSTAILATATPANGEFISAVVNPFDWVASPAASGVDTLWATANQGPCPAGYHVPTNTEWTTADAAALGSGNGTNGTTTTGWDNNTEVYESALKLPTPGIRSRSNSLLTNQGAAASYWSSNVNGAFARSLNVNSLGASTNGNARASGFSVRCIKN